MILVPAEPTRSEVSTYDRTPFASFPYRFTGPISWRWMWGTHEVNGQKSFIPNPRPALTFLAFGFVGGEVTRHEFGPFNQAGGEYLCEFDLPDGYYAGGVIYPNSLTMFKAFIVNRSGKPLPNPTPWNCTERLDLRDGAVGYGWVPVPYTGYVKPPVFKLKPRKIEPYSHRIPQSNWASLWTRRIGLNAHNCKIARFVETDGGDIAIEREQKYDLIMNKFGFNVPHETLRDGPKGEGTDGYYYSMHVSPDDPEAGFYFSDVLGRVGFKFFDDGRVITLAGWRNVPGKLKAHGVYHNSGNPPSRELYNGAYEYVGNWSQVRSAEKQFHEPWQMWPVFDTREGNKGHHELLTANTLGLNGGEILGINHLSAHMHDYREPFVKYLGYKPPSAPHGTSDVFTFLDRSMLIEQGKSPEEAALMMNEPWGVTINPHDGMVYWSNFTGTICRCEMTGAKAEIVFSTAQFITDGQLGIRRDGAGKTMRLLHGARSALLRPLSKPGPRGTHVLVRPQAMGFNSKGKIFWVERYTYKLRTGNPDTGVVEDVVDLPYDGHESGATDLNMAIDYNGWVGPKDDFFITGWKHGDYRLDANGKYVGRIWNHQRGGGSTVLNSTLIDTAPADYAWGPGIGRGRIVVQGSSGTPGTVYDITQKIPGDATVNVTRWNAAYRLYVSGTNPPMSLTHGVFGQGELGFPTWDEMGSWSEVKRREYLIGLGYTEINAIEVSWMIVMSTQHLDYSGAVEPPPPPPPPTPVDCVLSEWSDWTPISEWTECVDGQQSRTEKRTRTVLVPAAHGGKACGSTEETRTATQPCVMPPTELEQLQAEVTRLTEELGAAGVREDELTDANTSLQTRIAALQSKIDRISSHATSIVEIAKE